jgi:hypothetical protein
MSQNFRIPATLGDPAVDSSRVNVPESVPEAAHRYIRALAWLLRSASRAGRSARAGGRAGDRPARHIHALTQAG